MGDFTVTNRLNRYYTGMLLAIPTYILFIILLFVLVILGLIAVIFYAGAHKAAHIEEKASRKEQEKAREREKQQHSGI